MKSTLLAAAASVILISVGCHRNVARNSDCGCQPGTPGLGARGAAGPLAGRGRHGAARLHSGGGRHGAPGPLVGGGGPHGAAGPHSGGAGDGSGSYARRPTRVATLPHGYLQQQQPAGPPSATYGYPYYTTRAPRDFLLDDPPTIGR